MRGRGLFFAVELAQDGRPATDAAAWVVERMRERGVLLNVTQDRVIRLLPPLIFTAEQADALVQVLVPCVLDFLQTAPAH